MNISVSVDPVTPAAHRDAYADVDAWRGRCVRHFAKLEQAIARFLVKHDAEVLAAGHGLGCRLKQLAAFLEKMPAATPTLLRALRAMDAHKATRDAIVHGDGTIYVCAGGEWLWDCAVLNAREPLVRQPFRMAEAELFEAQLKKGVQSLCDSLDAYRQKSTPA